MRIEYFIVLGVLVVFPLALSFDEKLGLYRHPGALCVGVIGMCIPFWIWDVLATARGHWQFSHTYTIGAQLLGLPLEEWLFFPVVGFVSIFTWESVKYFLTRRKQR